MPDSVVCISNSNNKHYHSQLKTIRGLEIDIYIFFTLKQPASGQMFIIYILFIVNYCYHINYYYFLFKKI